MPVYNKGGNQPRQMTPGFSTYLFGAWPSDKAPTRFLINTVALTSNVATLTGTVIEGDIPVVGAFVTVQGTVVAGGAFNVIDTALTAVSISATDGTGTISFSLTHADVAATGDGGFANIPQSETSETLANGASIPATIPFQTAKMSGNRTVTAVVTFPTLPTAVTVYLQGALRDRDSEYENLGTTTVSTVSGGTLTVGPVASFTLDMHPFYRFNVSGLSGSGTIVAKLQT
jgi:hypothetical protein